MKEDFHLEYPSFKTQLQNFIDSTHFNTKLKEYEQMLSSIGSIEIKDMKVYLQDSIEFVQARNESLELIQEIVHINQELNTIFGMDEERLAKFCSHDIHNLHKIIESKLNNSAISLQRFDDVSKKGRDILEGLDDSLLSQGV